jgi:hypothetical protein
MPYKNAEDQKAAVRRRGQRAKVRRKTDPEFVAKEKAAVKKWYERKYKGDPEYKNHKNIKRTMDRYGITLDIYTLWLTKQHYGCAICKTPHVDIKGKRLHVDHDHSIGVKAIRGLLCSTCNLGLGMFKDNPALLHSAALYLESKK